MFSAATYTQTSAWAFSTQFSFIVLSLLFLPSTTSPNREQNNIYHNEFAVHIKGGFEAANRIAQSYGFGNAGQIGSLEDHYLFQHNHVHKRSTTISHEHHHVLQGEPEVLWFEQQKELKRNKRDLNEEIFDPLHRAPSIHDPLFKKQWFINGGAYDGTDMNVIPAWQKGITGKGVVVTILDDGIQRDHPDLKQNYDPDASTDINGGDKDPMPQDNGDNKHGTRCAGEVAAVAFNEYCGVGIAYNSSIGGVRMLDGMVNDAVEARALGLNPQHIDIYSASWGPEDDGKTVDGPGPLAKKAFTKGINEGRGGKGSIFVWASGNGGRKTDNCNCDGYTNSPYTLSISSATQGGRKPWYLEECSSTLATTYSSGTPSHDASITTVDQDKRLRPEKICTSAHTGTSASAPIAAGMCALALEINKGLTWRDMQHIVLETANPKPLLHEDGWEANGVGRKYSHKFGFGLMDGAAMVNLAEKWKTVGPQLKCESEVEYPDIIMPANPNDVTKLLISADGCNKKRKKKINHLEHVQCILSLKSMVRGAMKITLVSPQGTRSSLLFPRPKDQASGSFEDWPFMSVHFWGENPNGNWTIEVEHTQQIHGESENVIKKMQLVVFGTELLPNKREEAVVPNQQNKHTDTSYNIVDKKENYDFRSKPPLNFSYNYEYPNDVENGAMAKSYNKTLKECEDGFFDHLSYSCVSKCPPTTYQTFDYSCQPCSSRCKTCYGPLSNHCDSCKTDSKFAYYIHSKSSCYRKCPAGYFMPKFDHSQIQGVEVSKETLYEYSTLEEKNFKYCERCHNDCKSCDEQNRCTSCKNNFILHNRTCIADCPIGMYATTKSNNDQKTCNFCHDTCDTCIGPKEGQCAKCKKGYFFYERSCQKSCPQGYASDENTGECSPCPQGCAICTSPRYDTITNTFHQVCTRCEANWKLVGDLSTNSLSHNHRHVKCVPIFSPEKCDKTCETCFKGGNQGCVTCPPGHVLHIDSCSDRCPPSTYFLSSISNSSVERQLTTIDEMLLGECRHCPHACETCDSPLKCKSCHNGYVLRPIGEEHNLQLHQTGFETECVTSCGDGYFMDETEPNVCKRCDSRCKTCKNKNTCLSCKSKYFLSPSGDCAEQCNRGFITTINDYSNTFEDEEGRISQDATFLLVFKCAGCHQSCENCSGPGHDECISCKPGLGYSIMTKSCHPCDPGRYFDSKIKNQCRDCHMDCDLCHGPDIETCDKCKFPLARDKWNKTCVRCCDDSQDAIPNQIKSEVVEKPQPSVSTIKSSKLLKGKKEYCCQCDKLFNCVNPAYQQKLDEDASGKRSIFSKNTEIPSIMVSTSRKTLVLVSCLLIIGFFVFFISKKWKREKRRRKSQVNGKRRHLVDKLANIFSSSRNGGHKKMNRHNGGTYAYSKVPTNQLRDSQTMGSLDDSDGSEDSDGYEMEVGIRNGITKPLHSNSYHNGNTDKNNA